MNSLVRVDSHKAMNRGFGTQRLNDLLEKAMEREPEFRQKHSFAPSGLGYSGACPRYWYYAFNGAIFSYDTEATAVANMNNGTLAGQRLADVLDKAGLLVSSEGVAEHDDPPIKGYIDAVINWKVDEDAEEEEILVEIKTTNNNVWNWRVNKNTVPDYQLIQLLIYMYVTDHNGGFFMTENKDTHELFILPVRMTDENKALVEKVFEWMREVKDNADNGELPTRPFTQGSKECKGCPVKEVCYEGYKRGSVNGTDPAPGSVTIQPLDFEVLRRG